MKRFLILFLAVLCFCLGASSAFAETRTSAKKNTVEFTGNEMISNFSSAEFEQLFMSIQPGDSATVDISLLNSSSDDTVWYMHNEAIQSLEDSINSASGGLYTYILTYTSPSGKVTTLFSKDNRVGGELIKETNPEGLNQITDKMKDYFYLDKLAKGQSGKVNLYVELDGETQGNGYQNSLARLEAQFAVEKVPTSGTSTSTSTVTGVAYSTRPKTGDASGLAAAVLCGILSLLGAAFTFGKSRRISRAAGRAALVLALVLFCSVVIPGPDAFAEGSDRYLITVFAGNQGSFSSGSVYRKYFAPGANVNLDDVLDEAGYRENNSDKYYNRGIRMTGTDLDDTDSYSRNLKAFQAYQDATYSVTYGVKGKGTTYSAKYVDASGKDLLPSKSYYGNVGDKPVVAYKYIDGYQPSANNLTKTLVEDPAGNVFTFTYTPIVTPQTQTQTTNTVTYVNTGTAANTAATAADTNAEGTANDAAAQTDANGETAEGQTDANAAVEGQTDTDTNAAAAETVDAVPTQAPQHTAVPTPVPVQTVPEEQVPLAQPTPVPDIVDLDPVETPSFFDIPEMDVPLAQLQIRADQGDQSAKNAIIFRYCAAGVIALFLAFLVLFAILMIRRRRAAVPAASSAGYTDSRVQASSSGIDAIRASRISNTTSYSEANPTPYSTVNSSSYSGMNTELAAASGIAASGGVLSGDSYSSAVSSRFGTRPVHITTEKSSSAVSKASEAFLNELSETGKPFSGNGVSGTSGVRMNSPRPVEDVRIEDFKFYHPESEDTEKL